MHNKRWSLSKVFEHSQHSLSGRGTLNVIADSTVAEAHRAIVQPELLAGLDAALPHKVEHVDLLGVRVPGRDGEDVGLVLGAMGVVDQGQQIAGEAPDDDQLLRGVVPSCTAPRPSEGCPELPDWRPSAARPEGCPKLPRRPQELPSQQDICEGRMPLQDASQTQRSLHSLYCGDVNKPIRKQHGKCTTGACLPDYVQPPLIIMIASCGYALRSASSVIVECLKSLPGGRLGGKLGV